MCEENAGESWKAGEKPVNDKKSGLVIFPESEIKLKDTACPAQCEQGTSSPEEEGHCFHRPFLDAAVQRHYSN